MRVPALVCVLVWLCEWAFSITITLKEKLKTFWHKKLSHWRSKNLTRDSEKLDNIWVKSTRYWESNCQFDSNVHQVLGIPGRISVPPLTRLFRSKCVHFFSQRSLIQWVVKGTMILCSNSTPGTNFCVSLTKFFLHCQGSRKILKAF